MKNTSLLPQRRIHHSKDGIHIFVNPHWGGKFVTNDTGASVIQLMDQEKDEEKLIELIAQRLSINPYEAAARHLAFAEHLKEHNMLGESVVDEPELPRPEIGFLEVTRRCHTRCRLCYVDSGEDRADTLTKNEIFKTIDQMAGMGIQFIALSGGDPLAREDFVDIMEYIREEHDIIPGLSTSLLALREEDAQRMKEIDAVVQVSLDGSSPEINDWNRGEGSFEKTMRGLELLQRHEIPFRFAYVISKHNVEDVENMISLAINAGAKEVAFGKVREAGRARHLDTEAVPDVTEMTSAYHRLYRNHVLTRETGLKIRCKHNQPLLTGLQERAGCLPCGAGRRFVQVSYNGDIVPCSLLSGEKQFRLGNVRTDAVSDIWAGSPVYEFFRRTTVEDIDVCRDCSVKYLCGGGCRADAFLQHGDLYGRCGDCDDLLHYYDWILDRGCQPKFVTAF